jgi:hypothetical protein
MNNKSKLEGINGFWYLSSDKCDGSDHIRVNNQGVNSTDCPGRPSGYIRMVRINN